MAAPTVAAHLDGYRLAAQHLAGANGDAVPRMDTASLGHAGAEAAMGEFAGRMADYHANLTQAASSGAASISRLIANFERADRVG